MALNIWADRAALARVEGGAYNRAASMRILFVTSNRIGDAVLSTGLIGALLDRHADARFTLACGPAAAGLFAAMPRLERLVVMPKRRLSAHWLQLWLAAIGTAWDLVVDLRS